MKLPIIEWYQNIPDPEIREKAIRNCQFPDRIEKGFADAINGGFSWGGSPEGLDYWRAIHYGHSRTWPLPKETTWEDILIGYDAELPGEFPALLRYLQDNYEPPKKKV